MIMETTEGSLEIHDAAIQAVERNAAVTADVTAAYLQAIGVYDPDGDPLQLPGPFFLDLGAVLQLRQWEMEGLREWLPADLPTYAQAFADLIARATCIPHGFQTIDDAHLSRRVLQVWLHHFGWHARLILQADVVVGDADEEALVEAMAQLLWAHRHGPSP